MSDTRGQLVSVADYEDEFEEDGADDFQQSVNRRSPQDETRRLHPRDEFDHASALEEAQETKALSYKKILIVTGLVLLLGVVVFVGIWFGVVKRAPPPLTRFEVLIDDINATRVLETLKVLSSAPHLAGTPEDYQTAVYVKSRLDDLGLSTQLQQFNVLLSYPMQRVVELVSPTTYTCTMQELPVSVDPTSSDPRAVPTFNGYSASGDVTGKLVYVNYGTREDFLALDAQGVSFNNSIVIARYGKIFRANKCKQAEDRGAVGCLIYSDPADDGFVKGPVYPDGPWRPSSSVQRGTAYTGEGDPLTPGYPATDYAPRNTIDDARNPNIMGEWTLPKIPIQPLSYGDAYPLLKAIDGAQVGEKWQGGLNFTYHIGPGPAVVHMAIGSNLTLTPIWNVFGMIKGTKEPDRVVVIGNHRDAWVFGAGDPSSGTAAMLEVAEAFAALVKSGWAPERTILFASWDAEEYGLVGSTEWVERNFNLVQSQVVAYLNVDIAIAGRPVFSAGAVPSLTNLIEDITRKVQAPPSAKNPATGAALATVYDMWAANPDGGAIADTLGSGSDFTPFLQHAGVPALDLRILDTQDTYEAAYHSIYDSYYWMTKFGDPTGEYFQALARVWGGLALRLADEPIIPFNMTDYGVALRSYINAAVEYSKTISGAQFDFTAMYRAIDKYQAAATQFHNAVHDWSNIQPSSLSPYESRILNDRLMAHERAFLDYKGLKGRTWLRHVIFAPGAFDTYAGAVLPALMDAITIGDVKEVQYQANYIPIFIEAAAQALVGDFQ